jgi:iron-sulfur cluster assembly accessory protein
MSLATYEPKLGVSLSESALKHVIRELARRPGMKGLRLFLKLAGCSGFKYETELAAGPQDGDEVFQINPELAIYVPRKDLPSLSGTEIDFVTVGLNSMFQFHNPNVKGACGCGESFTVSEDSD